MITVNSDIVNTIEGLSKAELVTLINDLEDNTTDIDVILNKLSDGSYDVNNDAISIYDKLNTLEGDVSSIKKKINYTKLTGDITNKLLIGNKEGNLELVDNLTVDKSKSTILESEVLETDDLIVKDELYIKHKDEMKSLNDILEDLKKN